MKFSNCWTILNFEKKIEIELALKGVSLFPVWFTPSKESTFIYRGYLEVTDGVSSMISKACLSGRASCFLLWVGGNGR